MQQSRFPWCALAGIFLLSAHLSAQTTTPAVFPQGVTTGMVGVALNQTARINVVNLNPIIGTPVVCSVTLQFVDGSDNVVKSATIANIPPGQAAGLDLRREEIPDMSVLRQHVRGVVRNPLIPVAGSTAIPAGCNVFTTLEVFDDFSGNTLALTSDTRPLPPSPLAAAKPAN